jgi:hypothetical protein
LIGGGVVINGLPIIVKPPEYIFPQQPSEGLDLYYRNNVVGGEGHVLIESIGFDNFKLVIRRAILALTQCWCNRDQLAPSIRA